MALGFFGGDATVHDPGAPLFAVAGGDFTEHAGERGFIGGGTEEPSPAFFEVTEEGVTVS